ncbi:DUF421 domain-containing protein [Lachnoclostridium sp. MSJ-17]|uniref:DUF421 domain-containing protein n=1 Tax=Lachnoclostridium sp. MSJ-17 TaxID=2841516 RepID=UPI001C1064EA|nr:DUF421 domain-containing protein [Lachnoclostridium sp. MSJ-17]MBU5461410.1 DUF421 domain-containing protein [Lachnoclostridium sp. MSJ-17]
MDVLKVILASLFSAAALFLIAKVIGHKQVAQLEFFDYITGITIGSIAAELATTLDDPWWKPTISMFVFGAVTVALSFATRKMQRTRKFINGSPTIILNNGKLYRENMKKAKLELSEFLLLCRQEGYFNLNDIQTAVFEYNGKLSILPVSTKRPLNPEDMKLNPQPEHIGTEIIMDGRILDENLKRKGLNVEWLKKEMANQGYKHAKDIFLGICYDNNQLTLFPLKN